MYEWNIFKKEIIHFTETALFLLVFYGWSYISIIIHEAGHAIAAYLMGFSPYRSEIGSGKKKQLSFNLFSLNIVVLKRPYGGVTFFRPTFDKSLWWKGAIVSIAGALMDTLCILVLLGIGFLSSTLESEVLSKIILAAIISHLLQLVNNLIPRCIERNGEKILNDTKLFLYFLTSKYNKNSCEFEN